LLVITATVGLERDRPPSGRGPNFDALLAL
jgi:hypothetical protein